MIKTKSKTDTKKVGYIDFFKLFIKSVREYKKPSIIAIIFITLETLFECFIPYVMNLLLNFISDQNKSIIGGEAISENFIPITIGFGAGLLVMAFCSLICGITAGKFAAKASVGFATNIRQDLFYKIQSFSFNNIDKFSISSLVTRQTTDITYIQMCYQIMIRIALRAPLMFIFSIILASVMAPSLAWVYAILIPILAIALFLVVRFSLPIFNRVFDKYDALNESVEENVHGIRVVKTYTREDFEKQKFKKASENIRDDFVKAERILALSNPILTFALYVSMLFIVTFGSYSILMITGSTVEIGHISALITYGAQILSSLMMLSMVLVMISMSTASMRRVYEVLVEVPTIKNCDNPIYEVADGSIEYKNVSFKYRKDAEKYALADINLKFYSGETIGIIGGTGSSKSTLVNLLSRFYDTTEGEVIVSGHNVKDYDVKTLRENVSMVLQKNILFSGTIKENLRWGNKNATDEEIVEACKIAQADSFIETFPKKYDTLIQQGGSNVSGGQKQRLCIARAILKKPKILVMDDSTSAVDTKTDALIREGLSTTLNGTTKIIIAQRISSVQDADVILVMDDGHINGMGTHEELLKTNAIYKEIYDLQNRAGGDSND